MLSTRTQNSYSKIKLTNSTNKYRGVTAVAKNSKQSYSTKYIARIFVKGTQHYLGIFNTEIGARRAYLKAAKNLHGEFAA